MARAKNNDHVYVMGYHNKRMFKNGFFNPDIKNYNFLTGCLEPLSIKKYERKPKKP